MTAQLSPREREIAGRVAKGERVKDVAADLGLAPKTIEMNLYKAQRKLDARNRKQLLRAVLAHVA
jgi:DNA-binding CsgD family transcriptional regulator